MAGDAFGLMGKVLGGQFRVDEYVGEGGFSVVYKGFHMGLKEPVAIKCLRLPQLEKKELADQFGHRFRDESRIAYRLSQGNLNIARSITSGTTQDERGVVVPYMVLEWLSGETLALDFARRREHGDTGRSVGEALQLFGPAAEALAYAHSHGVIHRDVKPQNLFLASTREGVRLKVLDFGMAKILSDGTLGVAPLAQSLGTNLPVFSPIYAAPEQFDWKVGLIGTWTDVYSFAMVFLEALADKRVRVGDSLAECMMQACDSKKKLQPRALGIPLGDAVNDVLSRALSLKPKERPQDMNEFWAQLAQAHQSDGEQVRRVPNLASIPVSSSEPPEDMMTAVTDTRGMFTEADLGRPDSVARIPTAGNAFQPPLRAQDFAATEVSDPGAGQPTTGHSDVPTRAVDIGRVKREMQALTPAPAPHIEPRPQVAPQAAPMNRTLFGPGPIDPSAATAARPAQSAGAKAGLGRTMAMGIGPAASSPSPPSRAPVSHESEPPAATSDVKTIPAPRLDSGTMAAEEAAPPVIRQPGANAHDATEVAPALSELYPAGYHAPPPNASGYAGAGYPQPPQPAPYPQQQGGYPHQQQPYPHHPSQGQYSHAPQPPHQPSYPYPQQPAAAPYPNPQPPYPGQPHPQYGQPGPYPQHHPSQGAYPQTAGYAPLSPSAYGAPPSPYGQPPAPSPYGPPMMQGDGYVNVAVPSASKKPPVLAVAALGVVVVLVLSAIGYGAYSLTRSRMNATPIPTVHVDPIAPESTASAAAPGTSAPSANGAPAETASAAPPATTPPTESAAPSPSAAPAATEVAHPAATTEEPAATQAVPAKAAPTAAQGGASPSAARTTATPAPTAAPKPSASAAPVDPNAFNVDAARASLRSMEGILASCKKADGPTGPGKVKVIFGNAGNVTSAVMFGPPYEGTPVGDCAASRFKAARVPPFQGPPGTVEYGFRINK